MRIVPRLSVIQFMVILLCERKFTSVNFGRMGILQPLPLPQIADKNISFENFARRFRRPGKAGNRKTQHSRERGETQEAQTSRVRRVAS